MPSVKPAFAAAHFLAFSPTVTGEQFLALVERMLAEKGLSPTAASNEAVGNPYLISNMKKGMRNRGVPTLPSFENLQKLCDTLGLEFYIGPPRHDGTHRYDGTIDYSGGLSPLLREALCLDPGADEAAALDAIRRLPRSSHQFLRWMRRHRELRRAVRAQIAEARAALDRAAALAGRIAEPPDDDAPPGLAEPAALHDPPAPFARD